jgi:integrase
VAQLPAQRNDLNARKRRFEPQRIQNAYGTIIRLLILTGQRREEIGALRWSEIDFPAQMIHLSAERTKNGRANDTPLAEPAMRLLQAMPRRIGPKDFVFGTAANGFPAYNAAKGGPRPAYRRSATSGRRRADAPSRPA